MHTRIKSVLGLALIACICTLNTRADIVNLTPRPMEMTLSGGTYTLPTQIKIGANKLDKAIVAEATKFIEAIQAATPLRAGLVKSSKADIKLSLDKTCKAEGYKLDITASGISVKAATPAGFFYAFQSIKKMLPPNVMAGVRDPKVTTYSLPLLSINDEPRFGYRGFMLDVSRHFFTVGEVKRMIDIMAAYKMNVFHWHITDDQGWRVEIKKYPKLTSVGSVRSNSWTVDMNYGDYWTNSQYGPYFYTQDEIADIINYCHRRHIKVIPEVDMPGHFVAAMASYPEFSCTPNGNHSVWINGGVSSDVLNVANPKAVQFAKDILSEIMDLFPDGYIHIGGDECPTTAWQNNAECQALYTKLGLSDYRQLQSHFIKEISDYVKTRGYKMLMWNESITASGADLDLMKQTGATVMCWTPCQQAALKAAQLGLDNIVTEYHSATGGYYINRRQSNAPGEPNGAGYGDDTVEGCYNYVPVPTSVPRELLPHYTGVQGTFWTEHVANREYLEYLALPRLMAVAEAGWTPQDKKDFSDFRLRMMADTLMLNYNNYQYGRHAWASLYNPNFSQQVWNTLPKLTENDAIQLQCNVSGMRDIFIGDRSDQTNIVCDNQESPRSRWVVQNVSEMDKNYTQTALLYNPATKRYISAEKSGKVDKAGFPIKVTPLKKNAAKVTIVYSPKTNDYQIIVNGRNLFPLSATSPSLPSTICSGSTVTPDQQAVRPQGAAWLLHISQR